MNKELLKFSELLTNAKTKLAISEQMLTQTYPLLQDSRLLITVVEKIHSALVYSVKALMIIKKNSLLIEKNEMGLINEVRDIVNKHKKSPIEFSRNDMFIICDDNYEMKMISVEKLNQMIIDAKNFTKKIENIIKGEIIR